MKFLKILLPAGLLITMIIMAGSGSQIADATNNNRIGGAIMPHHLLVKHEMEALYAKIAGNEKNNVYKTVILISPNHFGYGYYPVQTSNEALKSLPANQIIHAMGPHIKDEHGITTHLPFISKYFPQAELIPMVIKPGTPQTTLDQLVDALGEFDPATTLVIASVDFSHVVDENTALQRDNETIAWLQNNHSGLTGAAMLIQLKTLADYNNGNPDSVAIDSPESIYVLTSLMKINNMDTFTLYKRTSSASFLHMDDPSQNTSHIFGTFQ